MRSAERNQITEPATPRISPDDYAAILRGLTLQRLALVDCQATCNHEAIDAVIGESGGLPLKIKDDASFELLDNTASIRHRYTLVSRQKGKTLSSVKAEYLVVFHIQEVPASGFADFFDVFRQIALPVYTWPYLRELVDSMTSRMDLPRLVLPLLHTQ